MKKNMKNAEANDVMDASAGSSTPATTTTTTTTTTVDTDAEEAEELAEAIEASGVGSAPQQQQQRRAYIAQLSVHIRQALENLGVAVGDDNDSNDKDEADESGRHSNHDNHGHDDDDDDDDTVLRRIESMSNLIHESMSISSRNYHSVQHALDVANGLMNLMNADDEIDDRDAPNGNDGDNNYYDPIAILAALFHDCVYYHVDGGLSELQQKKLKGAVACSSSSSSSSSNRDDRKDNNNNNSNMTIVYKTTATTPGDEDHDDLLLMVEYIFGYEHCQSLTHATGLNEFLSAMIAVRELEPLLSRKQLAQIAGCIEMTIPFRPNITTTIASTLGNNDDNETTTTATTTTTTTPADRLYANLVQANDKFSLNMTEQEITQSVQRACRLAHSDLSNFGTNDVLWFLDNTWSLLPESNEALRGQEYLYTVQQFQFAVFKMHGFFTFLSPDIIFPSFRGVPSPRVMQAKCENAKRNLQVGRRYVGAKLISISILSAIAELTGGDAPISRFMGDLPSRQADGSAGGSGAAAAAATPAKRRLGDELGLPPVELLHSDLGTGRSHPHGDNDKDGINRRAFIDPDVYNLLAFGRRSETDFDTRQSPLAAYLYGALGDVGLDELLNSGSNGAAAAVLWPMSEAAAWSLLQKLPLETVLAPIAEIICQVAVSRCDKIRKVLWELKTTTAATAT
jgi:hypothetical protein